MKKILLAFYIFCAFTYWSDAQNCVLTCISNVNVSLNPNECTVSLTPFYFLANGSSSTTPTLSCQAYILELEYPFGTHVTSPATSLDLSHAGYNMKYRVIDSVSKNSCWGTVHVNYCNQCAIKTPPKIISFMASAGPYIPGGNVTLSVDAMDDKSISKVDFYNWSTLQCSDPTFPYTCSYTFDSKYSTENRFWAIAYDNCGDTATAATILINTLEPKCNDGIMNGSETGIDCGGSACVACAVTCSPPTSLSASVSGSTATLSWNGSASLYHLEIENTTTNQIVFSSYASNPYSINLVDGNYRFKVKSKCGYVFSDWSSYGYFTISPYHYYCYPPSNLAYSINGNAVTISWTGTAPQYQLEIKNTSTNAIIVSNLNASSPYLINLSDGYYSFRIKSICGSLYSDWCDWIPFSVHTYVPTCYTPTPLSSSINYDQVHLSWSGSATQYQVEIENAHTYSNVVSVYTNNLYLNTTLNPGDYRWRVRCVCSGSYSEWSSWNTFTTQEWHSYPPPVAPCEPAHHLYSSVDHGNVNLGWSGAATEYDLEVKHMETQETNSYKLLGTDHMSMSMGHGSYQYKVKCHCGSVSSAWSETASFSVISDDAGSGGGGSSCDIPSQIAAMRADQKTKITWSGNAAAYNIELNQLSGGDKSVQLDVNEAEYNTTLTAGTYQCRVNSQCGANHSEWTSWFYFSVGASSMSANQTTDPSCTDIQSMEVVHATDTSITIKWSPTNSSSEYMLEIESEFSTVQYAYKLSGIRDTIIRLGGLTPNTQYKISLQSSCAIDHTGEVHSLETSTLAKYIQYPAKGECTVAPGINVITVSSTTASYHWLAVSRGKSYTIDISSQDGTPAYHQTKVVDNTQEFQSTDLIPGGSYTVRVKAECTYASGVYSSPIKFTMPVSSTLPAIGIESRSIPAPISVNIFPNPTHSKLNISFQGTVDNIKRIQLTNIHGQILFDQNQSLVNHSMSIALDQYSPGIYFIKVSSNQSQIVKKVVIE